MIDLWNQRYSAPTYCYGETPNLYFRDFIDTEPAGTILMPAEGEGRNAVYAASKGWQVDAFDWSLSGQSKALDLAHRNQVTINYLIASLETMNESIDCYDAIGLIYVHMPELLRKKVHTNCIKSLKKGGKIVLEAFSKDHQKYQIDNKNAGGPKDPTLLFSKDILTDDFIDLTILSIEEKNVTLNEGTYHCGFGAIVRMIGVKK